MQEAEVGNGSRKQKQEVETISKSEKLKQEVEERSRSECGKRKGKRKATVIRKREIKWDVKTEPNAHAIFTIIIGQTSIFLA